MDQAVAAGSNEFEQLTVHFDPGCLGREFFSYTLEDDADGDTSTANLAILLHCRRRPSDQITLSNAVIASTASQAL